MTSPPLPLETQAWLRRWIWLGVAALGVAGLYSLLLAGARTPRIQQIIPWKDLFHVALAVHVNLTVLVWFLACLCMVWTRGGPVTLLGRAGYFSTAAGALAMVVAPWFFEGNPLDNNYVPMLVNPLFALALGLLFMGALLMAAQTLIRARWLWPRSEEDAAAFGAHCAALILLFALAAFVWAGRALPPGLEPYDRYELLFWGGGHILQFVWTTLAMLGWMILTRACGAAQPLSPGVLAALYALGVLCVAPSLYAYTSYDIVSDEHRLWFTRQMQYVGGLAPSVAIVATAAALVRLGRPRPGTGAVWSCLVASLALFAFGGVLGWLISGVNVTIPAHYHGAIVGLSLGFMGLIYWLIPQVGGRAVGMLGTWQAWIYALGAAMHVSGFAWSGGYGVLRKTPGLMETAKAKAAMGLMGGGAMLSAVGGALFVIAVWRGLHKSVTCPER